MDRFQSSIEISAPASVCYEKWHHFDKFPAYMSHVKSVTSLGDKQWHWVVTDPLGADIEWDAEIDVDEPNRVISWHSLPDSDIKIQGAVRFDETAPGQTRMTATLQYGTSAGGLGEAIANLFHNPHKMVADELHNFKHLVEGTNIPAAKAQVGKTLHSDRFVTHEGMGGSEALGSQVALSGFLAGEFEENTITGYEGPYGLDNDVSDAVILGEMDENLEEFQELKTLQDQETPYLSEEGALHSEDLRDMQAFGSFNEEGDVFAESLDVEEEDLASYTEDRDDEIDIGLGPREEMPEPLEQARRETGSF